MEGKSELLVIKSEEGKGEEEQEVTPWRFSRVDGDRYTVRPPFHTQHSPVGKETPSRTEPHNLLACSCQKVAGRGANTDGMDPSGAGKRTLIVSGRAEWLYDTTLKGRQYNPEQLGLKEYT